MRLYFKLMASGRGAGGRSHNFVLLPWGIYTFVDNTDIAVLELPIRFFWSRFVYIYRHVVERVDHKTCHAATGEALWLRLSFSNTFCDRRGRDVGTDDTLWPNNMSLILWLCLLPWNTYCALRHALCSLCPALYSLRSAFCNAHCTMPTEYFRAPGPPNRGSVTSFGCQAHLPF